MAPNSNNVNKFVLFKSIWSRARQRRKKIESALHVLINRRQQILKVSLVVALLLSGRNSRTVPTLRSCRRLQPNSGWWNLVWEAYSDSGFKKAFRVSRKTFTFILNRIRHVLERKNVVEEPVEPALRLAISLYRLGRGAYYHTISELCGLGVSTCATVWSHCWSVMGRKRQQIHTTFGGRVPY